MKVIEGKFPIYLLVCDCDAGALSRLWFEVQWCNNKNMWILVDQSTKKLLETIGVFFDSFQEGIAEAIANYEREIEIKEKRDLFEVIQ